MKMVKLLNPKQDPNLQTLVQKVTLLDYPLPIDVHSKKIKKKYMLTA